ncbi:transposase [Flammeovirga sp. SJP92]|uniref:transposase n=2 Tax=Flammeovirga sp. SJP92 TaxID=1775430 RepID=UPI0007899B03|nr:transposase [Flammeovirga sp. SJP92]KXX66716.1 transposase [Flammeovirga sp. SJP92]KXX69233.1 transposase [Flammeovirga sp. SJP92]KXX69243.1 transposase [Flammeovirga sp. SJP92]
MKSKRKFTSEFKAKVALEAIKDLQTTTELAQKYDLHPTQISTWKKEFLDGASSVFEKSREKKKLQKVSEGKEDELYAKIGKLQVELDFLKKALS